MWKLFVTHIIQPVLILTTTFWGANNAIFAKSATCCLWNLLAHLYASGQMASILEENEGKEGEGEEGGVERGRMGKRERRRGDTKGSGYWWQCSLLAKEFLQMLLEPSWGLYSNTSQVYPPSKSCQHASLRPLDKRNHKGHAYFTDAESETKFSVL